MTAPNTPQSAAIIQCGGFSFERQGDQVQLRTPQGAAVTGYAGFALGLRHLLTMGMDLEGQAELDGGFVVRVEGERVRLRLGSYSEHFPLSEVIALFQRLTNAAGASQPAG